MNTEEFQQLVKQQIERLPILIQMQKVQAKLDRAKFLALVEEGFTEDQAIQLLRPRA